MVKQKNVKNSKDGTLVISGLDTEGISFTFDVPLICIHSNTTQCRKTVPRTEVTQFITETRK